MTIYVPFLSKHCGQTDKYSRQGFDLLFLILYLLKLHSRSVKKVHHLIICLLMLLLFIPEAAPQRNRQALEQKRKRLLEAMNQTRTELSQTREEKQEAMRKKNQLSGKIEKQEQRLDEVNQIILSASTKTERQYEVVNDLSTDLTRLKNDYGETLRRGFRQKLNYSLLSFLFAADDFNDLFKKLFYLRQVDRFRQKQLAAIKNTIDELEFSIVELEQGMVKNADTRAQLEELKMALDQKLNAQQKVFSGLTERERELKRELKRQQASHEQLSAAIDNIIRTEMEESSRKATAEVTIKKEPKAKNRESSSKNRAEEAKKENYSIRETPQVSELSKNFRNNRGKLPWPVRNGVISSRFGRQQHPTLSRVMIDNHGIDIRTNEGADVQTVFGGKVVAVQFLPETNYLIIVQHGSYYTVYSNLDRVYVKKGDEISTRKSIGKVTGNTLHFELWQNREKENPSHWIAGN